MRAAKERKLLESPAPEYPVELSEHWAEITVKRCINGYVQTETLFLDGITENSYMAWQPDTQECFGRMGLTRAMNKIKKRFVRVRSL
jgi:hypothetical protein